MALIENDLSLVRACLVGNRQAQKRFFDRFQSLAMGVARRFARDRAEAEDWQQEGLLRCFQRMATYKGDGSLEGWVRRVAVTACLDGLRRRQAQMGRWVMLEEAPDMPAEPDNAFLLEADAHELVEAIAALPDGARAIFNLNAVEGYTHAEVAASLGITESASRAQLARARRLLKERLQPNHSLSKMAKP